MGVGGCCDFLKIYFSFLLLSVRFTSSLSCGGEEEQGGIEREKREKERKKKIKGAVLPHNLLLPPFAPLPSALLPLLLRLLLSRSAHPFAVPPAEK